MADVISEDKLIEARELLYGGDLRRMDYYAYMYRETGRTAFLDQLRVSSGSGFLIGGLAWKANWLLKLENPERYPYNVDEFSHAIGIASLNMIMDPDNIVKENGAPKLDANGNRQYRVPTEVELYHDNHAVWVNRGLADSSPPRRNVSVAASTGSTTKLSWWTCIIFRRCAIC